MPIHFQRGVAKKIHHGLWDCEQVGLLLRGRKKNWADFNLNYKWQPCNADPSWLSGHKWWSANIAPTVHHTSKISCTESYLFRFSVMQDLSRNLHNCKDKNKCYLADAYPYCRFPLWVKSSRGWTAIVNE